MAIDEPNPRMSLEHCLSNGYRLKTIERHVRKWAIIKTLQTTDGHQGKAAELLGMHRNTLLRNMAELRIATATDGRRTNGGAHS
jgi:DNA-binding NtrC family response regulator